MESHPSDNHAMSNDYSRTPVPESSTASGLHIALIVTGTFIAIPTFLTAAEIGGSLGLSKAVPAFLAGSLVLAILGCLTSMAGATTRYSTSMLVQFTFGRRGAHLVNLILVLTLVGWYGVTCHVFGRASDEVVRSLTGLKLPQAFHAIVGGVLMVSVAVSGFKGIDRLAFYLVPLMVLFLGYTTFKTYGDVTDWNATADYANPDLTITTAISAVIGLYIVGVVIQPDYSRFARNLPHAALALIVALGIMLPLVLILASIPSIATGEKNLIDIMTALQIGLPAFLLLLLAAWSSNVIGLYSSGLSLSTVLPDVALWKHTLAAGIVGTLISLTPVETFFIPFLVTLGITIPPVASIYIIHLFLIQSGSCDRQMLDRQPSVNAGAFVSWTGGALLGYSSYQQYLTLTTVPGMDAILGSTILYGTVAVLISKNRKENPA
ncbi:MAG: cytosine permease [Planctomycetota bacterium]|nr:cytosine permease [Planctomycetota bacterium]